METQIFYWTGVVVWWCIMAGIAISVFCGAVAAPIFVWHRVRKVWWQWQTLAKFAATGWTQEQLKEIANRAGVSDDVFFDTARRVLKAAKDIKSR